MKQGTAAFFRACGFCAAVVLVTDEGPAMLHRLTRVVLGIGVAIWVVTAAASLATVSAQTEATAVASPRRASFRRRQVQPLQRLCYRHSVFCSRSSGNDSSRGTLLPLCWSVLRILVDQREPRLRRVQSARVAPGRPRTVSGAGSLTPRCGVPAKVPSVTFATPPPIAAPCAGRAIPLTHPPPALRWRGPSTRTEVANGAAPAHMLDLRFWVG